MHPLQTVSGRVPLPDSLLNFHAKMSQYEMQHFQGELLRDKSEMGLIFLLSAQMTTGVQDRKKHATMTTK